MRLTTMQLESIFKTKINSRKTIDDSKLDIIIEKVEVLNKNILIKYGSDPDLQKEITIYEKVLNNSGNYPVPQLLISKNINHIHFLAMEWIDGIHPDFKNMIDIENVFTSLGSWAAHWSHTIKNNNDVQRENLSNFKVLDNLLKNNENFLIHILGNSLIELLYKCIQKSDNMIKSIKKLPLTLDPGDISLHNFIINSDETVIFIDFESCKVSPMITLVEHLGEEYESIPHKKDDIYLALKSYLKAWNKSSSVNINWDDFLYCQLCARIHYIIGNFNYWIKRIIEDKNIEETLEWVKQGHEQLKLLLSPEYTPIK